MSEPYWMELKAVANRLCMSTVQVRRLVVGGYIKRDLLPGFKRYHKYVTSSVNEYLELAKKGGKKK